jgi:hypothetical protein
MLWRRLPPRPSWTCPRFLIEELLPFSVREETAANRPLPLDDPESVWWVTRGQVDVFFPLPGLDGGPGRRRHLCRVDEGGSIFAISGVRGHAGGGLMAVGVGTARLLRFARGDLIRLGFEQRLAEQVAVVIDDWILRVGRALSLVMAPPGRQELDLATATELSRGTRYGVREGVAWIRHLDGSSFFLDEVPLPVTELIVGFAPDLTMEDAWQARSWPGSKTTSAVFPWACTPFSGKAETTSPAASASGS